MALPPGLILNPATGEVTGIPTQTGTFALQLKVRDTLGTTRIIDESVTINPYTQMSFTNGYAPFMATRAYSDAPAVNGGLAPILYSLVGGVLPAGVSLNVSNGVLSGTPTTPDAFGFTIRATDTLNQTEDITVNGTVAANLVLEYLSIVPGTVGVAYNRAATVSGGTGPATFALVSGTLPPGLSVNPSTGAISGTPTGGSGANAVIRITDANGFTADAAPFSITVAAFPALTGTLARGTATRAYSQGYAATGGHAPLTFGATGLPPGVSINTGTGLITGTPTTPGDYAVVVTATDAQGNVAQRGNTVSIAADLTIGGSVPAATRNIAYSFTPTVAGGWTPRVFDISAGSLPAGVTLNTSTGVISGTPTTQQTTNATLRVTDADGNTATMAVNITVAGDLTLTGTTPDFGTTTVAYNGTTYAASGGLAPYTWSIAAGALPPGLSLNTSTGAITGTPTTPDTYPITVRVSDANASQAQSSVSIAVAAFPALSGTLPDASNGVAYSASYSASGGHAPLAYDISAGALPTGLSINASTGAITGTPSANGGFTFTVRATDARGNVTTRAQTVTVFAQPSLSGTYTPEAEFAIGNGTDGSDYNSSITAAGGKPSLSWGLSGSLPPGLSFNNGTGAITGTVGYADTLGQPYIDYSFTVTITDQLGRQAASNQSIRAYQHVSMPLGSHASGTVGVAYSSTIAGFAGKAPYSYAITGGALPPGLSLNAGTGAVTGTPTTSGTYAFTVTATDQLGKTASRSSNAVEIYPVAAISGAPPAGTVGVAYAHTFTASGGNGSYSFAVVAGALPAGLTLNSSTGQITGTPTTAQNPSFTVRVTSAGSTADLATSLNIAAYPVLSISAGRGTVGRAYSGTASTSGGHAPLSYSVVAGALPSGLSLNSSTGAITGTPNANATYNFTIRVTDAKGNTDDEAGSIAIAAAVSISSAYATPATQGSAYSSTVNASGGWTPYSFSVVSGAPPTGLAVNSGGTLSGTPSAAGTFNFTVRATDADGNIGDRAMSVVVNAGAPAYSVSISPDPAYGSATSFGGAPAQASVGVLATGNGGTVQSYAWTFVSGDGAITPDNTNSNGVTFSTPSGTLIQSWSATWRCTITFVGGATAFDDLPITLERFNDS